LPVLNTDRTLDLHAHTTASDGDQSPTQLVQRAHAIGLTALAVTDHDTTAGLSEALEAGRRLGVEIVPGIELSAEIEVGQCHILGLLIDPAYPALNDRLREVIENRDKRNERIVEKMQKDLHLDITLEEVEAESGGQVVARPHFAKVLLRKGYVTSMQQAFDEYLGKGSKAYVDRDRLTPEECIALIHGAGGVAILAHPNNLKRNEAGTEAEILRLQSLGMDGIEARYNRHTPEENAYYLALAARHDLLTSGGSDFHGPTVKPTVYLGHVEGDQPAPLELLDRLKEHSVRD
jgi:predicted metal-dependent phosphoesterase TrpH